jgi:Zn-finger nucleic acid-binding protein
MNCPSCGAPIALKPDTEGYRCDYCHAVFYPGEEDDGVQVSSEPSDPSLACPVCSIPLVKATIVKIPTLYCSQCHGLLLPMQVLQPVLETMTDELRSGDQSSAVQTPPDRGDLKRTVQCPNCHRRMDTHYYSGPGNVIVDSCDDCSLIWFDRGELTRIARAPDGSDAEEPSWD